MEIREFQDLMRRIYFHRDSKRGATETFNWFVDEVEELRAAVKGRDKKALEDEFADVLAWLASLANVVGIDLEGATMKKYDDKCPKCRQVPCNCAF
ncbi:nucleotide pyrophosphohydrolase [Candidatus Bathyarchaeota archaeon]|nr:nucleotide pyrophosphohydrolase [Candidatus Bathyarchaeota archaeon]